MTASGDGKHIAAVSAYRASSPGIRRLIWRSLSCALLCLIPASTFAGTVYLSGTTGGVLDHSSDTVIITNDVTISTNQGYLVVYAKNIVITNNANIDANGMGFRGGGGGGGSGKGTGGTGGTAGYTNIAGEAGQASSVNDGGDGGRGGGHASLEGYAAYSGTNGVVEGSGGDGGQGSGPFGGSGGSGGQTVLDAGTNGVSGGYNAITNNDESAIGSFYSGVPDSYTNYTIFRGSGSGGGGGGYGGNNDGGAGGDGGAAGGALVGNDAGGAFIGPTNYGSVGDRVVRTYRVGAAQNDVTNTRIGQSVITDDRSGTNTWTDANAAGLYTSRYYDLSVFYGGGSYTNSELWGMYVQDRNPNEEFLICVPVEHYAASQRNLNSALGRQLARGLHADTSTNAADEIRYFDTNGVWYLYHLFSDSDLGYWSDDLGATTSDVPVFPGMAMWVKRRGGSVIRGNNVFGGRLFTDSTATNFFFGIGNDEFTMFGWPLPEPRRHIRNGTATATNQLGFAAHGSGGTANHFDPENRRGDRIWVWQNNEWFTFYELMDNVGADWDGKWWHRHNPGGPDYADFSLEPGRGYYYRHVTNIWGGVEFEWAPESP